MRITSNEKFTVASSATKDLILSRGEVGDTTTAELYIQTTSSVTFALTGKVNSAESATVTIPVIDCSTYSVAPSASTAGLYMAMTTGLDSVEATFAGAGDVTIKTVY